MKNLLTTLLMCVSFIGISQNFSNDPKVISIIPTEGKSKEIKIKNDSKYAEVFIIYCCNNTDKYWKKIGSVSIFQLTEGKFFVQEGFNYAFNISGKRPISIGSNKEWKVRNKDIKD